MTRMPLKLKQYALCIAIISWATTIHPTKLWNSTPKDSDFWEVAGMLHEPPRKFIRETAESFFETGSLLPKRYRRRKRKSTAMPDDEARLAAMYLKLGHWVPIIKNNGQDVRLVHRYFATVQSAVNLCPGLKALKDKYHLTNKKLLYHMHQADPKLLRRRVHIKYGFSTEELTARQERANALWGKCNTSPDWLDRTYFIDECSIWIHNEAFKGMKVYADAHDRGFHHVIHHNQLHKNKKIKVRFIVAVNARNGKVYLEFTTGTTKIKRIHNVLPNNTPYKVGACIICVSYLLPGYDNVSMCNGVNPKPCQALR